MEKQKLIINGGNQLQGEITVQGAKNSSLPLLSATVLVCEGECVLHNCPRLTDVDYAMRILSCIGVKCRREGSTVITDASAVNNNEIPQSLMREMRSSIVFLGAMLGRLNSCKLSFPGGCELGPRPIDLHLSALREMGAVITEQHGYLLCSAPRGLHGADISLSFPSVGATENIMLAAVRAKGITQIHNAAREPEICDLAKFLTACGAKVHGAGTDIIIVEGVERLSATEHTVISDRIVAATYLAAVGCCKGELILSGVQSAYLGQIIPLMQSMGCRIYSFGRDSVYIRVKDRLKAPPTIRTMPYPGFPTDAQALLMTATATAQGTTVFVENIFENRYRHVSELARMGAKIKVEGKVAVVEGVPTLYGSELQATDLRGGAALVLAALAAEGRSVVTRLCYIDRGYENIEAVLRTVGADIRRV
ncbi:MAG: UDP-N-acetylglucosamine 1-carboxyvinyltransferase [Ruminiclostridium sp.]|nr:UDP-N-acetylglucosamine 1-carboxyvinyltransferase [Ruminiclostridium sp.]